MIDTNSYNIICKSENDVWVKNSSGEVICKTTSEIQAKKICEALTEYENAGYPVSIKWNVEDVLEVRPDLTEEQAFAVLRSVESNHDANIGINWDVLTCVAAELFPET